MKRRAVVLGSGGQLGTELMRELASRGFEVQGFERGALDITDPAQVQRALTEIEPEAVYNSAAYNQVDAAEQDPQTALAVNGLAVRHIAVACRRMGARLVHYSTDYVFDGSKGSPYGESDPTHPIGAYAVSKLAGELYANAYLDDALVVRCSGVYGPGGVRTARGNFVELMLRLASAGQPIRVLDDHTASPTYAPVLAARTIDLVEQGHSGIFHLGGGRPISWYEYAKLIFEAAGVKPDLRPTSEREYHTAARRPKYSALSNAKAERLGLKPFPALEEALAAYFAGREALAAR